MPPLRTLFNSERDIPVRTGTMVEQPSRAGQAARLASDQGRAAGDGLADAGVTPLSGDPLADRPGS